MYTVTDLGTMDGSSSESTGINSLGQVIGNSGIHSFRTAPNTPIDLTNNDLGRSYCVDGTPTNPPEVGCLSFSSAYGINNLGQVAGGLEVGLGVNDFLAFRTAPNSQITGQNELQRNATIATAINSRGQTLVIVPYVESYRTPANRLGYRFNQFGQNLGSLAPEGHPVGVGRTDAFGINDLGQAVGASDLGIEPFGSNFHAFRTTPNHPINPVTDDLGTLGGSVSYAYGINVFGQVVGNASTSGDATFRAFRTSPNSPINSATDDLGTLGGSYSGATSINNYGQVVGWSSLVGDAVQHSFIYGGGAMHDLNNLVSPEGDCEIVGAQAGGYSPLTPHINDRGQIAANRICNGQQHAVLLTPIYEAFIQQPINPDGSSVFAPRRGVVPVKFTLAQQGTSTCDLPPATITLTRIAGRRLFAVQPSGGSGFGIDQAACQYAYSLGASQLGAGTYRVDISINDIFVGHAVFALRK